MYTQVIIDELNEEEDTTPTLTPGCRHESNAHPFQGLSKA